MVELTNCEKCLNFNKTKFKFLFTNVFYSKKVKCFSSLPTYFI
jgi:hypothetical protein